MRKKIGDGELLEMMKEGIPQKDIAKHFGVSCPAICKRLKRLLPPPQSLENLTDKEKRFAIEVAKGKTATQAVLNSFEVSSMNSAKVIGSQLMAKDDIRNAISEVLESKGGGRAHRVNKLIQHMNHPDPVVSLKALDMGFKLSGDEAEGKRVNPETPTVKTVIDMAKYANFTTTRMKNNDM